MKLSEQPSRIVGVMAGEVSMNLIRPDRDHPTLKVKFGLLVDEGVAGYSEISGIGSSWSEKTLKAMSAFLEAIEEDGLRLLFKAGPQAPETPQAEGRTEPPQF